MDILEIIDDREPTVSENISKPFACPSEGCGKVWLGFLLLDFEDLTYRN